jgi:hypothetical protein
MGKKMITKISRNEKCKAPSTYKKKKEIKIIKNLLVIKTHKMPSKK